MHERIGDGLLINFKLSRHIVNGLRFSDTLFKDGSDGQNLLGRTRLNDLGNSAGVHIGQLKTLSTGIHRRRICQRQNRAVTHVHHNGRTPLSLQFLSTGFNHLLRKILYVLIDGQPHTLTVLGRGVLFVPDRYTNTVS